MKGSDFFRQKNIFSNIFRFIDNLCIFNNDEMQWYLSWWAGTQEGKWRSLKSLTLGEKFIIGNLQPNCLIKDIPFSSILIACPIVRTTTDLINMVTRVIFLLIGVNIRKVVTVFVLFHYWKISLGNILKYFKFADIASEFIMCICMYIFSSKYACMYLCIYVCMYVCMYVCVCVCVWHLFACAYIAVYLCL